MTVTSVQGQLGLFQSAVQQTLKQPVLLKIQMVFFEALNIFCSSIAGLTGFSVGIIGGAILITAGAVVGVGSLALHLLNLYGMCVKDGAEGAYSTCYTFLNRYKPEAL